MKKIATLLIILAGISNTPAAAEELTLAWAYNRYFFNQLVGFKLFMAKGAGLPATLIADVPKASVTITKEKPILLEEHFNTDPGTKYPLKRGAWSWQAETKNMKIDGPDFMIVFPLAAGVDNDMSFSFWPLASSSDQPIVYSYLKDEAISAYYELRLAGADGIRYSTWRKCYDSRWGGVDGAFGLPRYVQCPTKSTGVTYCPGIRVYMGWKPGHYSARVEGLVGDKPIEEGVGYGTDTKPLDLNKLEIIISNQSGWIDDIIIGGKMEVQYKATVELTPGEEVFFTATAYRNDPDDVTKIIESSPSIGARYTLTQEPEKRAPPPVKNLRKKPDAS